MCASGGAGMVGPCWWWSRSIMPPWCWGGQLLLLLPTRTSSLHRMLLLASAGVCSAADGPKKGEAAAMSTGAEAVLDLLERAGIEFLFCSPIAALAPLWEAFAKRAAKRAKQQQDAPGEQGQARARQQDSKGGRVPIAHCLPACLTGGVGCALRRVRWRRGWRGVRELPAREPGRGAGHGLLQADRAAAGTTTIMHHP